MIEEKDIISFKFTNNQIKECIEIANNLTDSVVDRKDLHNRDYLERFLDILMGEIAEKLVISWLQQNKKFVKSAVDKTSGKPDLGHDIILRAKDGREIKGSIKSSLSVFKQPTDIINEFTLATTAREVRDVNIQVYFWLNTQATPRRNLPNTDNLAIIAWCGKKDIDRFDSYKKEERQAPQKKLKELRTMGELLNMLD